MSGGYTGKILNIDLKKQTTSVEKTNLADAKNFIGAKGLGAKILFDRLEIDKWIRAKGSQDGKPIRQKQQTLSKYISQRSESY